MAPSTLAISSLSPSPSPGARKKRWASPGADSNSSHHETETRSTGNTRSDLQNVTPDQVVEHSDACENAPNHGLARLPSLPSEILYSIASELRRSTSIFDFALVNRHLNNVVQQALVREALIPKNHIRPFLEMLITRQDLIKTVKAIDLGDYVCGHPVRCFCVGKANFDAASMKVLNKAISANTGRVVSLSEIRQHMRRPGPLWRKNHSFFFYVLLSLCPNITSVAFELPEIFAFDSSRPPLSMHLAPSELPVFNEEILPVTPFHGPVLALMQKKLEVLIIKEDTKWKGPVKREILYTPQDVFWRNVGRYAITLPGFVKLKRLDLPIDVLGQPHSIVFVDPTLTSEKNIQSALEDNNESSGVNGLKPVPRLSRVLPFTLEYMHLRACNQWTFALLHKINNIPRDRLHLKHIEAFFKACPQSSISLCYATDEGRLDYPRILSELEGKGVRVSFFTGKSEAPFDMRKELAALSALSPLEVWRFALAKMPYSELNEAASLRRRQSITSSHLFMKHAHDYMSLMNTPTFNGKVWAHVAFFHGFKNTKWDPGVLPQTSKKQTIDSSLWPSRALRKRAMKRRLPVLLDLNNASFNFRLEQILSSPPPEIQFLNKNFSSLPKTHLIQKEKNRSSNKKVPSDKDENNSPVYRQGHWIDRVEASKLRGEKSLEQNMTQLRLASGFGFGSNDSAMGLCFSPESKFQAISWTGIDWKLHFCVPDVSETAI